MEADRVLEILVSRGMRPKSHWLAACLADAIGAPHLPVESLAEKCFAHLLVADFNLVADATLPPDLHSMHKVELPGPFVLQVDEVVNISCGLRDRYRETNAGIGNRCLKLSMTDGAQRVSGIEYRPIPQLKVLQPAGLKICVRNVCVRRGMLLLVPEVVIVLGGVVEELEEARQRLVQQVNKPPRGNRYPQGVTPPSLEQQLSQAAWPRTPDVEEVNPATVNRRDEQQQTSSTAQDSSASNFHLNTEQTSRQQRPWPDSSSRDTPVSLGTSRIRMLSLQPDHDSSTARQTSTTELTLPFTYLAVLQRRFLDSGAAQSGRCKGFLTAVKNFLFKDCYEFRLTVYIEDGSLVTEALLDPQLVERMIGHSAPEVSAALSNSDHRRMKLKMREFQSFLQSYQGYMDIEFGDAVRVMALHDCPYESGEAWSLVDRVEVQGL